MFGSATRTPFGSNTSFGFASGNQPNPFASAPQIFSTASTFGTTAPAFGQTSTNMFGSTQQPAPLFGSTTAPSFGNTNQNAFGSTGLFGQQSQTQQSTGIFGGPSTSFGQSNKPSGFSFPFGQTPQQQPTQANVFQNPGSTSIFGQSGFGSQPAQSGTVIKFVPVTGSDSMQKSGNTTMINTKHYSITCMKEYESKSFEELRFEDYAVNRKGPQQSTGFGAPTQPFGTAPATTSLFGQPDNKPAFGSTNGFGQTSSFGVPSQASTSQGIFGKPATAFGSTVTTASSFGFPTSSSNIFGSTPAKPFSSQPSQTLFPSTSQQAGGFGTPFFGQSTNQQPTFPTQTGSYTFGQPAASTQSSLFQPPKSSTGFGAIFSGNQATTSTAFGQPSTTGFSGFNSTFAKPAQNTFGQGTQPQTGFGTGISMPTNNLFNAMGNKPTFGTGTTSGGLFSTTGLQMNNPPFSLQMQPASQPVVPSAQSQTLEMRGMLNLSDPYGFSPHLDGLTACKSDSTHYVTNPKELDDVIKKQDFGPSSSPGTKKLKLNMINPTMNKLFEEAYDVDDATMKNFGIRRNPKRLLIKVPVKKPEPIIVYQNGKIVDSNTTSSGNLNLPSVFQTQNSSDTGRGPNISTPNQDKNDTGKTNTSINTSITELKVPERNNTTELEVSAPSTSSDDGQKASPPVLIEDTEVEQPTTPKGVDTCGIVSTRPEYYTIPPLNEIAKYKNPDGSCFIKGFTIGRIGYGNVYFPDVMDVSNLNIDDLVHFRFREIIIYPDDDNKPPVGEGLNRRAQVTLDRVYPRKADNENEFDTEPEEIIKRHYTETLKFACERANTSFVDYRPETGSWVFNVVHFSKYTFTAEEEKYCEDKIKETEKSKHKQPSRSKELRELPNYNEPMDIAVLGQEDGGRVMAGYTITSVTDPIVDLNISTSNYFSMEKQNSNIVLMRSLFYEDNETIDKTIVDSQIADVISITDRIIKLEERISDVTIRKSYESIRNIYSLSNELCRVPVEESLVPNKCMIDAAIMKGKSFKVGWGRGFTLATIFSEGVEGVYHIANTLETYVYTPTEVAIVDVSQSCLLETNEDPFLNQLPRFMDIILQNSRCVNESLRNPRRKLPRWEVKCGSELTEKICAHWSLHSEKHKNNVKLQYYKNIWDLCSTFWGPMIGHHPPDIIRKQRFNEWLENVTKELMNGHLNSWDDGFFNSVPLKKILIYLSGHHIKEAAKLAVSSKMPSLSLLISQLNTNNLTRYCMQSQINDWETSGAIEFITEDHLKLYILCCGALYYHGLIVCEGFDWLRALGMHLWYQSSSTDSLKSCIDAYENSFMRENPCAAKPYPIFGSANYTWDIMYYLMKLYCDQRLDLDIILSPATHTDNSVDYRLSWLLMLTLQSLNIGVVSENGVNKIITMFATQLEQLGFLKWSIFVVLFLKDVRMRENLVFGILDRNLSDSLFDRNIEKELVVDLNIPLHWIHRVKANKTKQLEKYWECYRHLAYSQLWNEYHEMFVRHVLPTIVCNQHFDILKDILTEMSEAKSEIVRWKICGNFLLEFAEMWSQIQRKLDSNDGYEYTRIYHMISDFAWKVCNYPEADLSQNMVISVISQKTAELFNNFLKVLPVDKKTYIKKTSNVLAHLVMPNDFRFENLSNILISYYDKSE